MPLVPLENIVRTIEPPSAFFLLSEFFFTKLHGRRSEPARAHVREQMTVAPPTISK